MHVDILLFRELLLIEMRARLNRFVAITVLIEGLLGDDKRDAVSAQVDPLILLVRDALIIYWTALAAKVAVHVVAGCEDELYAAGVTFPVHSNGEQLAITVPIEANELPFVGVANACQMRLSKFVGLCELLPVLLRANVIVKQLLRLLLRRPDPRPDNHFDEAWVYARLFSAGILNTEREHHTGFVPYTYRLDCLSEYFWLVI